MVGGASAGSSRAFRLDPLTLPVRFSALIGGNARESAIVLDRERALFRRPMRAGPPVTVTVPVRSYSGVAVRMEPLGDAGGLLVVVELLHRDPDLSFPLIVADRPEDVAADWEAWGLALNLPLLVIGPDGEIEAPLEPLAHLSLGRVRPRRRHGFFNGRRGRFARRRKPGRTAAVERLTFREIIAPE